MHAKHYIALIMMVAAGYLALSAEATTYPSNSTTEYFYVTLEVDDYLQLSTQETGDWKILIDDVTFSGECRPPCEPDSACSVFDSSDVGPDNSESYEVTDPWQDVTSITGSPNPVYNAFLSFSNSQTESLQTFTTGRKWSNRLMLRDEGTTEEPFETVVIDEQEFAGHASVAMRQQEASAYFERFQVLTTVDGNPAADNDASIGGAGGAGVGVGTGVGATGWHTPVSCSRHYQTPYVMQGPRIYLRDLEYPNGRVHIKGRVVLDSPPIVSTRVAVVEAQ